MSYFVRIALIFVLSAIFGYLIHEIVDRTRYAGKMLIDVEHFKGPCMVLQQDIPLQTMMSKHVVYFAVDPKADLSQRDFSMFDSDDSKN